MAVRKPVRRSGDPYADPQMAGYLDSFEGWLPQRPGTSPDAVPLREMSWQQRGNAAFAWAGEIVPGLVLAVALAAAARAASTWLGVDVLGFEKSPISAVMLTIAIGLLVRNTVGLPEVYDPGLTLCVRRVLRIGVALLGIRLSLVAAGGLGLRGVPVVLGCIASALLLVSLFSRLLGLSSRLGSLIGVGTSICGVSAIVATAPAIDADDEEVSYAVACITLFGMLALFVYPFLAHAIFDGDPRQAGMFLGTAIHDTAQVAGAGLMYQEQFAAPRGMDAAVVVKLVRNLFMIGVIPLMAFLYHRGGTVPGDVPPWYRLVPLFVLGFVAMIVVRTLGDAGVGPFAWVDPKTWQSFVSGAAAAAGWCLTLAMAGVGLGTRLSSLRRLGWRPLAVGLAAAACVGGVSIALVKVLA
jgi:uncharacterized integral membrane protein (TIGR00698 family)